ncbi:MAG: hypothetical protein IJL89_00685 [Firmicutes bacterium]|nr:hypothetical protein [Bacillota bacterium]
MDEKFEKYQRYLKLLTGLHIFMGLSWLMPVIPFRYLWLVYIKVISSIPWSSCVILLLHFIYYIIYCGIIKEYNEEAIGVSIKYALINAAVPFCTAGVVALFIIITGGF